MIKSAFIVLVCAFCTGRATEIDEAMKARILSHMEHMFISPDNQRVDKFAYYLFKHGYTVSGCSQQTPEDKDYAKECMKLKTNKDVDSLMTSVVEKYVYPDVVNGIMLWNLALPLMPQMYASTDDYYYVPKRGCPDTRQCGYQLTSRPFTFDANQCERAFIYLQLLKYHMEPMDLPMDYYTLAYYVLTKVGLKAENIYGLDPDIKLFEIKHFLTKVLPTTHALDDFVLYMMGRRRKLELYKELADKVENPDFRQWKHDIEKEIAFERMLIAMMLHAWMELTGLPLSEDGSLFLKDNVGNILMYQPDELVV